MGVGAVLCSSLIAIINVVTFEVYECLCVLIFAFEKKNVCRLVFMFMCECVCSEASVLQGMSKHAAVSIKRAK